MDNQKTYTIKELADIFGKSKPTISAAIKNSDLAQNFAVNKNDNRKVKRYDINVYNMLAQNYRKITAKYDDKTLNNSDSTAKHSFENQIKFLENQIQKKDTQLSKISDSHSQEIKILTEQLSKKDDQLSQKDKQLEKLSNLVDQEQQLNLVNNQKLLSLQEQVDQSKKSFWYRLFH